MESCEIRVSIIPTLSAYGLTAQDLAAPGYAVSVQWDEEDRQVSLGLTRIATVGTVQVTAPWAGEMREGFSFSQGAAQTGIHKDEGGVRYFANSLPLAVTRIVNAIYPTFDSAWVPVSLHVRNGAGAGFKLTTEVLLDLSDPVVFPASAKFEVLEAICEPPAVLSERIETASPGGLRVVDEEPSLVHGDVRLNSSKLAAAYTPLLARGGWSPPEDSHHVMYDAYTFIDTDVNEKYKMLAQYVKFSCAGGPVLVAGDHPGALGRSLGMAGIGTIGVDPLNIDSTMPLRGGQVRRLIPGRLYADDPGGVLEGISEWSMLVADTVEDAEPAEASTARNLALGSWAERKGKAAVFQLRSAPLQHGTYILLRTRGHSKQGCEQYACRERRGVAWEKYGWAKVVVDGSGLRAFLAEDRWGKFFDPFFDREGVGYRIPAQQWFHFVNTQAWLCAYDEMDPVARAVSDTTDTLGLLVATGVIRAGMSEQERRGLRNLFDPPRTVDTPGLPDGLLARMPGMRDCIRLRYKHLLKSCTYQLASANDSVKGLFSRSRNGALLHRLSAVRGAIGFDPVIARYDRVLPYEDLAALGSSAIFCLLERILLVHGPSTGKQMHAWELQRLLWSLTCFGTAREKFRFLLVMLEDLVCEPPRGRAPMPFGEGTRHAYNAFCSKLRDLDLGAAYARADPAWAEWHASRAGISRPVSRARSSTGSTYRPPPPSILRGSISRRTSTSSHVDVFDAFSELGDDT